MRHAKKFIIIFFVSMAVLGILGAFSANTYMNVIRKSTDNTIIRIISNVCEMYPDITNVEIVKILNDKSDDFYTVDMLRHYGITENEWSILKNEEMKHTLVVSNVLFFLLGGFSLFGLFLIYLRVQQNEVRRITNYLVKINNGQYDLNLRYNSEGVISILENEIYKTTVHLRESCEASMKDKMILKDSISDISHQLKTPLTSIMIMVDNIIDDKDMPEEIKDEFIADIKKSTVHISFLVQSLLKLSRLDANAVDFTKKPENIRDIFSDCMKKTELLAEVREVNVSAGSEDIDLICDKKWITEAFTNIVKNCIEHTNRNGSVTLLAKDSRFDTKIIISDTGCGISEKELPYIFERFYKTKNSSEDSIGIGLSLSKAIIEKHNGYIIADSEVGKGTTFTIKFLKNL